MAHVNDHQCTRSPSKVAPNEQTGAFEHDKQQASGRGRCRIEYRAGMSIPRVRACNVPVTTAGIQGQILRVPGFPTLVWCR